MFASTIPGIASAQTRTPAPTPPAGGQALEIAPPVLNLTAKPGETIRTQIALRDVSTSKLKVTSQINDFVAAGEDGTPKIILEADAEPSPYSMKAWIAPLAELTLDPKQIRNLPVVIRVPADAAPGGYYSVVRFTATAPEMKDTGVSLSASLGSLILVRVSGDAKESMEIEEFAIQKDGQSGSVFQSTPLTFVERLKNTGNIHEQPTGLVTITDMFGKKVATLPINSPPRNVLPGSIRKFDQPLDQTVIGNKKLFGKYTASFTMTYGDDKQELTVTKTFWVIPYTLIAIIIFALIAGFFILRVLIKRYNKRIISNANKGRR